jgi:hypothetical protein
MRTPLQIKESGQNSAHYTTLNTVCEIIVARVSIDSFVIVLLVNVSCFI